MFSHLSQVMRFSILNMDCYCVATRFISDLATCIQISKRPTYVPTATKIDWCLKFGEPQCLLVGLTAAASKNESPQIIPLVLDNSGRINEQRARCTGFGNQSAKHTQVYNLACDCQGLEKNWTQRISGGNRYLLLRRPLE